MRCPSVLFDNLAMICVDVEEISKHLAAYLERVETGETLIITRAGRAVAEIKSRAEAATALRPDGPGAGEFGARDDFDEPL